jgi:hypothetical protein
MALSTHDQSKIREYLLGHLNDEELEQVEERLIVDDDFGEEVQISQGEIIEEYYAGELTEAERQWFERHYLASRDGRQRYALAVAINCLKDTSVPARPSWFERLRKFLTLHTSAVATTATAMVLVIAIAGFLTSRTGSGTVVSFALTSTAARRGPNNSEIYRLKLNPNVSELRISLTLPNTATAGASYRAELDDRRNTKTVKVVEQNGNSIVVSIPATDVPIGYYALRLFSTPTGMSEQQLPGDYRFMVE